VKTTDTMRPQGWTPPALEAHGSDEIVDANELRPEWFCCDLDVDAIRALFHRRLLSYTFALPAAPIMSSRAHWWWPGVAGFC
jgi:hypothetical protein